MRIFLSGCITLIAISAFPFLVQAQNEKVQELQQRIQELRRQIEQYEKNNREESAGSVMPQPGFQKDLSVGDRGPQVERLQRFLNSRPGIQIAQRGPGSPGQETVYFGERTRQAVIEFQERHRSEILVPAGLSRATGYVGPSTRSVINRMVEQSRSRDKDESNEAPRDPIGPPGTPRHDGSGADDSDASGEREEPEERPAPAISGVSPKRGPEGTEITLTGSNFSTQKNTIEVNLASPDMYPVIASPNGEMLSFPLDTSVGNELQNRLDDLPAEGVERVKEQFPSELRVRLKVVNRYGESEPVTFFLTPFQDI